MKKIALTALAALTIASVTQAADSVELKSKASKLQFSGTHYIGYVGNDNGPSAGTTGNFEIRRNYLQVKAYLLEDPKSYLRVTLDTVYSDAKDNYADTYIKYAYLYLHNVLPYTGVELGMAHRPWIDYEEHQGWWMRSISKVFVEASEAAHLTNSADLGINFKTKTPYFTSEVGLFNGEGYHGKSTTEAIGTGNSAEWRATVAALGNGEIKRKPTKDSYADASFFGQYNVKNSANTANTYLFYGVHAVYNTPSFLASAQYVISENDDTATTDWNGNGYSVNGTYRVGDKKQYSAIARYDRWNKELNGSVTEKTDNIIAGLAWQQDKNVKWLATGQIFSNADTSSANDYKKVMLTAEVHW